MQELQISQINLYPIKSTAGVSVTEWPLESRGLAMDRRWMLVDEGGEFLTGREHPALTQVETRIEDGGLRVAAPAMEELAIPVPGDGAATVSVTVWGDRCEAVLAGKQANDWFSAYLGSRCRLVHMGEACVRKVDPDYGQPGDPVSFADGYPLLLISEASLTDLNTRVAEPVSMRRFRPNLVVSGCAPYEEDYWRELRIGDIRLHGVKACSRCVFTTIDPDSGEKHPNQEPLRTLSSYRRGPDGGVFFGQNLIPRSVGTLRIGDTVEISNV